MLVGYCGVIVHDPLALYWQFKRAKWNSPLVVEV